MYRIEDGSLRAGDIPTVVREGEVGQDCRLVFTIGAVVVVLMLFLFSITHREFIDGKPYTWQNKKVPFLFNEKVPILFNEKVPISLSAVLGNRIHVYLAARGDSPDSSPKFEVYDVLPVFAHDQYAGKSRGYYGKYFTGNIVSHRISLFPDGCEITLPRDMLMREINILGVGLDMAKVIVRNSRGEVVWRSPCFLRNYFISRDGAQYARIIF